MSHDAPHARLADPDPWMVMAQSRAERGLILAAACRTALARIGVALFLLAAAARLGHAGLFGRMMGR